MPVHRIAAAALVALVLVLAPTSARAAGPAPTVGAVDVAPSLLFPEGGLVTLSADIANATSVQAEVAGPAGTLKAPLTAPAGSARHAGDIDVPANGTAATQTYKASITATGPGGTVTVGAGEITVDPLVPLDDPPLLSDASVTPRALPSAGGPVTLGVTASDPGGVGEVAATLHLPGGRSQQVPLAAAGGGRYTAVFRAPANPEAEVARYGVELTAADSGGQVAFADGGEFEVAALAGAAAGTGSQAGVPGLRFVPAARWFGVVRAGRRTRRTIVLRNRGTADVAGTIRAPGAPYSLVGSRGDLRFRLRPGQARAIRMDFRPRTRGLHRRSLAVRVDGGRRGPALRVSGRATARRR